MLQKLFLSFNKITSIEEISLPCLTDLTLDCNPVDKPDKKLLKINFPSLVFLNQTKITLID
jgi:hypothetical protein